MGFVHVDCAGILKNLIRRTKKTSKVQQQQQEQKYIDICYEMKQSSH